MSYFGKTYYGSAYYGSSYWGTVSDIVEVVKYKVVEFVNYIKQVVEWDNEL